MKNALPTQDRPAAESGGPVLYSSVSRVRRPASPLTGRENTRDWALLFMPAWSMTAFMMGFLSSTRARMKINSRSEAMDTPKNRLASSVPVPLA